MFSRIKNYYKNKSGINEIVAQNMAIQKELSALHRKSDELYWSMVFNNTISDSAWLLNKSFSPGRMAAGYPMLYLLYRIYNDVKPNSILEFGLGESTKIVYQYQRAFPESRLLVIEQDENWLDYFSTQIFDIRAKTILLPLEEVIVEGKEVNQYKGLLNNIGNEQYQLFVIDGPKGSAEYSRHQIVDLLKNDMLEEDFIIIMDDYDRMGEKQTIEKLKQQLDKKEMSYAERVYAGIKDTYIICSKKYNFLISL